MAFTQTIEAEAKGFYFGTQIESTPSNSIDTFVINYQLLDSDIVPNSVVVNAISTDPLVLPAPADADLIVGLTINGIYTEDFTYNPVAGTITVNISCS